MKKSPGITCALSIQIGPRLNELEEEFYNLEEHSDQAHWAKREAPKLFSVLRAHLVRDKEILAGMDEIIKELKEADKR